MADGGRITARQASICKILAHMPHEGGPQRYRVQSESEGFERVVAESDLSPLPASAALAAEG